MKAQMRKTIHSLSINKQGQFVKKQIPTNDLVDLSGMRHYIKYAKIMTM